VDPRRAALALPDGALVVRVLNRRLAFTDKKELRYVQGEDIAPMPSPAEAERYAAPQNDFLWIPRAEWQTLIPAEPRKDEQVAVPSTLALRLFRFHLDPCRGFTEGSAFANARSDAGRLKLTVQDVTSDKVVLRLEGSARLRQPGRDEPSVYEPDILGYLEFDSGRKTCTRFDVVALGTASGLPRDANGKVITKGPYPLGIAFELVPNPTPAERLHPRGARDNPRAYLEPRDRR
jgi:hypothetical protein